jgi:hypothetical protein
MARRLNWALDDDIVSGWALDADVSECVRVGRVSGKSRRAEKKTRGRESGCENRQIVCVGEQKLFELQLQC